jgi:hypothetical protein
MRAILIIAASLTGGDARKAKARVVVLPRGPRPTRSTSRRALRGTTGGAGITDRLGLVAGDPFSQARAFTWLGTIARAQNSRGAAFGDAAAVFPLT